MMELRLAVAGTLYSFANSAQAFIMGMGPTM